MDGARWREAPLDQNRVQMRLTFEVPFTCIKIPGLRDYTTTKR